MEFNDSTMVKREGLSEPFNGGRQLMTFHCGKCNAVLTDSFGVAGEIPWLDSLICPKVTYSVLICDTKMFGPKKEGGNCIFSGLKCRICKSDIGRIVHSSPASLDILRCGYLLCKDNINCYILDSKSMVKSTAFCFDQQPFLKNLHETKKMFQATLSEMTSLKNKVDAKAVVPKKKKDKSKKSSSVSKD